MIINGKEYVAHKDKVSFRNKLPPQKLTLTFDFQVKKKTPLCYIRWIDWLIGKVLRIK